MSANRLPLTAVAAIAAIMLAGCANDEDTGPDAQSGNEQPSAAVTPAEATGSPSAAPSETEQPEADGPVVEITIAGDSVLPIAEQVKLAVGDTLTLAVDSDREAELHVHSTPEQTVAVTPGTKEYTLTFDKPGTVDIEEHASHVILVRALVS